MKKLSNGEMKKVEGGRFCQVRSYKQGIFIPTTKWCPKGYGYDRKRAMRFDIEKKMWFVIWEH